MAEKEIRTPVFDREFLLRCMDGDAEFAAGILEVFAEDCLRLIADFKQAIRNGNPDEARRCAHSLKGAAGNVGALRLQEAARKAENAAEKGNTEEISSTLRVIEEEFAAFRREAEESELRNDPEFRKNSD